MQCGLEGFPVVPFFFFFFRPASSRCLNGSFTRFAFPLVKRRPVLRLRLLGRAPVDSRLSTRASNNYTQQQAQARVGLLSSTRIH